VTLYFIIYNAMKSHGEVEIKHKALCIFSHSTIQADLGDKVTIVGGNNIRHCEKDWMWVVGDTEPFESGVQCSSISLLWCVRFMFVVLNDGRSLQSVDIRDDLFSHILDTAAHIKKGEDRLGWTKRDLRTNRRVRWGQTVFQSPNCPFSMTFSDQNDVKHFLYHLHLYCILYPYVHCVFIRF